MLKWTIPLGFGVPCSVFNIQKSGEIPNNEQGMMSVEMDDSFGLLPFLTKIIRPALAGDCFYSPPVLPFPENRKFFCYGLPAGSFTCLPL